MKIIGELKAILGLDKRKFDEGLKGATKEAKTMGNTFGSIFKSLGVAYGIKELVRFGLETAKLAAKAEGVRTAFDRLNQPTLLQDLRKATQNTVSDIELMKNAIKASNFKLPLDQLATYFEFATRRARETGESVEYMVDSIVLGISRESVKILDNLGISAKEIGEELKTAGTYAQAVGNIISREMAKAGRATDDAGVKFMQFSAAWEGFKESSGDVVNKSGLPNLLQRWSAQMRILGEESLTTGKKIALLVATRVDRDVIDSYQEWMNTLREASKINAYNPVAGAAAAAGMGGKFNMLAGITPAKITTIQNLTEEVASLEEYLMSLDIRNTEDIKKTLEQIKVKKDLIDKLTGVTKAVKENKREIQDASQVWGEMLKPEQMALGKVAYGKDQFGGLVGTGGMTQLFADPTKLAETATTLITSYDEINASVLRAAGSIQDVFYGALTSDEGVFEAMGQALKRLAAQFAAAAAAAAILAFAISMIPGLGTLAGVGEGAKFGDMFKMLLKGGMGIGAANGLSVPPGYPNDSFGPVMLTSGETVLTAKQSDWLKNGMLVQVTGEISGRNIAINGRRQNYSN